MRESVDPATVVGRGKLDEIRAEVQAHQTPLIVFDGNLTPVQQRNLERGVDCRVIDARNSSSTFLPATPAAARQLQVELANSITCCRALRQRSAAFALGRRYRTRDLASRSSKPIAAASVSA